MKFILASQNAHKAEEFASAIQSITVIPAEHGVDVDENADSFIGNARLKARAFAEVFKDNALADDSGLCVDALNGAPGIYSQRFAVMGEDVDNDVDRTAANNRKLLRHLSGLEREQRGAHFTCALCLVVVKPEDIERMKTIALSHAEAQISFFDEKEQSVDMYSPSIVRAELVLEGQAFGYILEEKRGENGFGYDPLFFCPETNCTFAELTRLQKLTVSHRGKAIANLRSIIE